MATLPYDEDLNEGTAAGAYPDDTERDLDNIFSNWHVLAALAWQGYATRGCGAVVVSLAVECADVAYTSGILPRAYARYVDRYNPREQIVVVVRHPDGEQVYLLTGHPTPRDCFEQSVAQPTTADLYRIPRESREH
jgi:hypothetical protein